MQELRQRFVLDVLGEGFQVHVSQLRSNTATTKRTFLPLRWAMPTLLFISGHTAGAPCGPGEPWRRDRLPGEQYRDRQIADRQRRSSLVPGSFCRLGRPTALIVFRWDRVPPAD